ncbi:hypothetical protein CYMTET_12006 [Cymbomonas tetramitiformis]|uniref:Uncharacterized protein n=1 Tax=Cymbomonas tetramitiformis TaxID=36881 RepID=A0AAE0LCW2_9CHLO|nr:hypothetical protein CYMTET_12006 [Cymbomonas tetramitiformis]
MKVDATLIGSIIGARQPGSPEALLSTPQSPMAKAPSSLHETLHTNNGVVAVHKWFQAQATPVSGQSCSSPLQGSGGVRALMECDFCPLMKRLTDLPDHEIYELMDILDLEDVGGVLLKEFYLILALLSAMDRLQRLEVLYLHAKDMYDLLAGERYQLGWQGLRLWGLILGVKDSVLWETRVGLEVPLGPSLTFEDFQLLLYAVVRGEGVGALPASKTTSSDLPKQSSGNKMCRLQ